MVSYRAQLKKIGYGDHDVVAYSSFFLAPPSLRAAMQSMDTASFTQVVPGDEWDADWTDEIQGVAYKQGRWFFTQNSGDDRRLWVLRDGDMKKLKSWNLNSVPHPPVPGFTLYHIGAVQIVGDEIFIDHWFGGAQSCGQILVMRGDENSMDYVRWIPIDPVLGVGQRMGMIAVNREAGRIITANGDKNVHQLCLHDMEGHYLGKTVTLKPGISDGCYAQGGFWSPNNLIYMSSGEGAIGDSAKGQQYIYMISPLNGCVLGAIAVPSLAGKQELEGCCYAPVSRGGKPVQVHAVLLENEVGSKDDVYFKSFAGVPVNLI